MNKIISLNLSYRMQALEEIALRRNCSVEDLILDLVDRLIKEDGLIVNISSEDYNDKCLIDIDDYNEHVLLSNGSYKHNCSQIYNQNG